jgi:hypothetical protein
MNRDETRPQSKELKAPGNPKESSKHQSLASKERSSTQSVKTGYQEAMNRDETRPRSKELKATGNPNELSKHQTLSSNERNITQSAKKGHKEAMKRVETRPRSKEPKATGNPKESSKRRHSESHISQTSGIASNERHNRSRRRVRNKTASASKITLQSFTNDVSFNFR